MYVMAYYALGMVTFSVNRHRKKSNSKGRIKNNLVRVYIEEYTSLVTRIKPVFLFDSICRSCWPVFCL